MVILLDAVSTDAVDSFKSKLMLKARNLLFYTPEAVSTWHATVNDLRRMREGLVKKDHYRKNQEEGLVIFFRIPR